MLTCAQCGEENPERARFCLACGAALGQAAAPREVRKRVTILFCDLTGSTALGEQLDPEAFRATQRRYFEGARTILERHGGTVEKFIGDAVMAVFGVPRSHEDDALRAVRASVELRDAVIGLGLEARIGVNTGEVVAGEGDALVTGDAVNVAARLEQRAEPGEILIGAETQQLVRDAVGVEPLDLTVKGKRAAVSAYRLLRVDHAASGLVRRLDSPLVGRERELQRLRDDFDHALSRRSAQLFTLLGPPGVGKSRLVEEFVRETRERARIVRGRCLHYGDGITYWPLVEVLLQLGVDPASIIDLPSTADAAVASRKLLEANAAEQPLVVVWDDIQWAEPTFLDLVEHVADWSRAAPILLLCVARPELLDLRPTWGGGKANATSLLLEPLAQDETSTLIDNLLDGAELAEETRARIVAAAGGNPLFVEEMLLMLDGDGRGDVVVPPTIHALLQARLDQLAADERSVIERGSIEGEVFHRLPVAELASDGVRSSLDTHLAKLIRTELIRPEAATMPDDDAFRFRHLLIRDAAYDSLPKETRADLHERFARWLDDHVELVEQDEVVGYHLERAALYRRELGRDDTALGERAADRLAAAGRGAQARGDNRAAVRLLERAIALRSPPGRLDLLPDLVLGHLDLGRPADALECVDELAAGDEQARVYASLLGPMVQHIGGTGSFQAGRAQRDAAVAAFERMGDHRGLALARLMQGHDEWTSCRAEAAAAWYREALAHAERARRQSLVEEAINNLSINGLFGPRHVAEVEEELLALLARSSSFSVHASAYRTLSRLAAIRGSFDEARELMGRGRERLAEAGLVLHHAASSMAVAYVEEQAGDYETAAEIQRRGVAELTAFGEAAYASTVAANLAFSLVQLGRTDEADAALATARELCPPEDIGTIVTAAIVDALLALRRGALDVALDAARSAVEQADDTDFWQFRGGAREALAAVLVERGDSADAATVLDAAVEVYRSKGATVAEARALASRAEL